MAHLRLADQGGDLAVSWVRRARVGGDPWGAEDVPLSEAFERYAVRVFHDGVLTRQDTATSSGWTYSETAQANDGPALEIRIDVAQISDVFGEGPSRSVVWSA